MHQLESPCIDSIVFDTPWKRRSNDASSAALELRAPWPLAAPEPAAIFPPVFTDRSLMVQRELKLMRTTANTPPYLAISKHH